MLVVMGTTLLVSEEEYLRSSYSPDCDFEAGQVVERHVGEREHSILQRELVFFFRGLSAATGLQVFPEQRIKVGEAQYRVPDVCVYRKPAPRDKVFTRPPLLVIEILSGEDRMSRVRRKIDEYLRFGVTYVWVIDPEARRADVYTADRIYEARERVLRIDDPMVEVPLDPIFQALDE